MIPSSNSFLEIILGLLENTRKFETLIRSSDTLLTSEMGTQTACGHVV